MAKLNLQVSLKKDDGTLIGSVISSGDKPTRTAALEAINAVIQQRVETAQGAAQDIVDAQAAFNS